MCKKWSYSTLTFRGATVLIIAPSALDSVSFFTPYWLQSFPSPKLPSPKFTNLGLWHACSNGFHDKGHKCEVKFYGCVETSCLTASTTISPGASGSPSWGWWWCTSPPCSSSSRRRSCRERRSPASCRKSSSTPWNGPCRAKQTHTRTFLNSNLNSRNIPCRNWVWS